MATDTCWVFCEKKFEVSINKQNAPNFACFFVMTGDHLKPGSFDTILVVDQREAAAHMGAMSTLHSMLSSEGIPYTLRMLPIGDFAWICKDKNSTNKMIK